MPGPVGVLLALSVRHHSSRNYTRRSTVAGNKENYLGPNEIAEIFCSSRKEVEYVGGFAMTTVSEFPSLSNELVVILAKYYIASMYRSASDALSAPDRTKGYPFNKRDRFGNVHGSGQTTCKHCQ